MNVNQIKKTIIDYINEMYYRNKILKDENLSLKTENENLKKKIDELNEFIEDLKESIAISASLLKSSK